VVKPNRGSKISVSVRRFGLEVDGATAALYRDVFAVEVRDPANHGTGPTVIVMPAVPAATAHWAALCPAIFEDVTTEHEARMMAALCAAAVVVPTVSGAGPEAVAVAHDHVPVTAIGEDEHRRTLAALADIADRLTSVHDGVGIDELPQSVQAVIAGLDGRAQPTSDAATAVALPASQGSAVGEPTKPSWGWRWRLVGLVILAGVLWMHVSFLMRWSDLRSLRRSGVAITGSLERVAKSASLKTWTTYEAQYTWTIGGKKRSKTEEIDGALFESLQRKLSSAIQLRDVAVLQNPADAGEVILAENTRGPSGFLWLAAIDGLAITMVGLGFLEQRRQRKETLVVAPD
jgi:hypothetical protein